MPLIEAIFVNWGVKNIRYDETKLMIASLQIKNKL